MPKAVGSVGAAFLGGLVVAVGGEGTTEASDAVQAYDVAGKQWTQLPPLPSPRHGAAVASLEDSLFAIGGATTAGHVESTATSTVLDLD
jgi:N-acetylneuraminic acid mutarotase